MKRPLVFLSWGATVAPLGPGLAERYTLVVPDAGLAERLRQAGLAALPWNVLVDGQRMAGFESAAATIARDAMARLASEVAPGWRFGGRDHAAVVRPALEQLLARKLAMQLAIAEIGRTLAETGRLAAAVVHEDVTGPIRAFLAAIRPFGVPSIHVPHGVYVKERLVGADVHGGVHTDVVAAGGPVQREWFVARGVATDRLVVTGNPAWDRLCGRRRDEFPPLALPPGPVVTVATSWLGTVCAHQEFMAAQHDSWTRAALAGAARLKRARPDVRVVVKLHPSAPADEAARLQTLAVAAGVVPDLVTSGDAAPILARSDVLVTLPSTIAIEAMLLGTPVVAPEFEYDGLAVETTEATGAAVAAALERVLGPYGRSPVFAARRAFFLARYNGPSDGRAGERVAALVDAVAARAGAAGTAPARDRLRPLATARAHLGTVLLDHGAHDDAELLLREATVLDPRSDWAWGGLGVLAAVRGQVPEARALLERALALDARNPFARQVLDALGGGAS